MTEKRWLYFALGAVAVIVFAPGAWAGDGTLEEAYTDQGAARRPGTSPAFSQPKGEEAT